jgi:hypothetical protein
MAGLNCVQTFSGVQGVASAFKTLCQLTAPANQRVRLKAVRLGCSGTVTTDPPIQVRLIVQTTGGTGGVSGTPVSVDADLTETIQTTTLTGPTAASAWTAEPTATNVVYLDTIHPQGRIPEVHLLPELWIKGGGRIGLQVNVGSGATNTFYGALFFEE